MKTNTTQNKTENQTRTPRFDMAEIRKSQKAAAELFAKFAEAEGRRLALKEGRAL